MARRPVAPVLAAATAALVLVAGVVTSAASGLVPRAWLANHLLVWSVVAVLAAAAAGLAVWQVLLAPRDDRRPGGVQQGGISAGGDLQISAAYVAGRDLRVEEQPSTPAEPLDASRPDE